MALMPPAECTRYFSPDDNSNISTLFSYSVLIVTLPPTVCSRETLNLYSAKGYFPFL